MAMNVSQSQINLYRKCPYAYALRYQYKKEGIMYDPSIIEVGKRVHDAIDVYYKNHFQINIDEAEILRKVYNVLRNEWDTTLPAAHLKKAYVCLSNFAKFEYNNLNKGMGLKPFTECRIPYDGLYGIVDYVDIATRQVIDFKTNTRAGLGGAYKIQATMYKILVEGKYNIDINRFTFLFLYPNEWRIVKFDEKTREIEESIYKDRDKIQKSWQTNEFPKEPKTPKACNNCEYRYYCDGV